MLCLSPELLVTSLLIPFIWSSSVSARATLYKGGSRTSPPSGAIVVKSSDATYGEFTSVQAAVNSLSNDGSSRSIFIYPGEIADHAAPFFSTNQNEIQGHTASRSLYLAPVL